MPETRYPPDDPREWLNRARSNLAKAAITAGYLEDACFDAQQAAEKALKAVCVKLRLQFPYIHDLDRLNVFLEAAGVPIPAEVWEARDLTPFAYERRYPYTGDPVSREEYERLLNIARTVVGWAEEYVQSRT